MRAVLSAIVVFLACASDPAQAQSGPPRFTQTGGCDCGTVELHNGVDWTAKPGTAVPAADHGVIVRIETREDAAVYTRTGGFCGRYVVLRHSYPNGRVAFTRYAQLGRIAGKDDAPLAVGAKLAKGDPVGVVGSKGILHFEVRPLDEKSADRSLEFTSLYARDPSMEWLRYRPIDPARFDFGKYGTEPVR